MGRRVGARRASANVDGRPIVPHPASDWSAERADGGLTLMDGSRVGVIGAGPPFRAREVGPAGGRAAASVLRAPVTAQLLEGDHLLDRAKRERVLVQFPKGRPGVAEFARQLDELGILCRRPFPRLARGNLHPPG